jgi:FMN-dependent NADH-azoreductase
MEKLLYIEASPRGERSKSTKVAKAFIEEYQKAHPDVQIEHINLWKVSLPTFDGDMLDAKYAVLTGQNQTPEQEAAWQKVKDMAEVFKSADKYVISTPMWNFGIPYKLKHYIDIITQPGLTFSFSPEEGYKGLVSGKAAVIYARGGAYPEGSDTEAYDMQTKTLGLHLGFMGITDQTNIVIEPTLSSTDDVNSTMAKAVELAASKAASF